MKKIFLIILLALTAYTSSAQTLSPHIIGGTNAEIANHPWQVSFKRGGNHACGGSIISDEWILLAAHCLPQNYEYTALTVHAGINNQTNTAEGQIVAVAQNGIKHHAYIHGGGESDIMLIKLASKLRFNDKVQPIPYANLCNSFDNLTANSIMATISGWGYTSPTQVGFPNEQLMQVSIPIIPNAAADQLNVQNPDFYTSYNGALVTNNMFAAYQNGQGHAFYDSGGPVTVINPQTGKPILAGVVSWGIKPAGQYPSVQTKVRNFGEWINQTSGVPYYYGWVKGADAFCGTATYSLENLPINTTVQWSVSPS
jgi:trypsin